MINILWGAITALFFWNKSTKDVEEKTQLASWTRTIVYGLFAAVILVFYLKTYKVASTYHIIQLSGIVETTDSTGNVVDSVATVKIFNKFSNGITENNEYQDLYVDNKEYEQISKYGGVFVAQNVSNGKKYTKRINESFKQEFQQAYKRIPINDDGYILGEQPVTNYSHAYQLVYTTSRIPSLIPLFAKFKIDKEDSIPYFSSYKRMIFSDYDSFEGKKVRKNELADIWGDVHELKEKEDTKHEMYVFCQIMTDTITNFDEYHYRYAYEDNFTNRMNFFTAADVSQYVINLEINTECNIKNLSFYYDLPIEINKYDSDMEVSSCSFSLKGDYLNNKIANNGIHKFHVKLPTLANLQLIRSLILTTLLTGFSSLFLLNLFYRLRKHGICFKEKHIKEISKDRVETLRKIMAVMLYLFLCIIAYVTWRIFKDDSFRISNDMADFLYGNYGWIIIGFIVLFIVIMYYLFKRAYTIKIKK